jgi:dihydrofolate synthase/folylpolyglutamate synthase
MKKRLELESLERLGWRFGLESIRALLDELGDPHLHLRVIHVAGSNGKGSTSAFLSSFFRLSGYRTGLYTSPHLCDIRERFRINGLWISREDFRRYSKRVLEACDHVRRKLGRLPTHFEALTALAFLWFKEKKVEWVVLETGLGGRLDATNVVPSPAVCLITSVGLEHQDILGKTIEKIAREKAGILKSGCLAATVQPGAEASGAIDQAAREKGVRLWLAGRDFNFRKKSGGFYWEGPGFKKNIRLGRLPLFQISNAALALAGIQMLKGFGVRADVRTIEKSFSSVRWPGRAEEISRKPLIVADGAHNPEAAKALFEFLRQRYPGRHWLVLNGFLADKDYCAFIQSLKTLAVFSIVTEPPSGRKKDGKNIFYAWEKQNVPSLFVKDWSKALDLALSLLKHKHLRAGLIITGSLYLVGSCRHRLIGLRGLEII